MAIVKITYLNPWGVECSIGATAPVSGCDGSLEAAVCAVAAWDRFRALEFVRLVVRPDGDPEEWLDGILAQEPTRVSNAAIERANAHV